MSMNIDEWFESRLHDSERATMLVMSSDGVIAIYVIWFFEPIYLLIKCRTSTAQICIKMCVCVLAYRFCYYLIFVVTVPSPGVGTGVVCFSSPCSLMCLRCEWEHTFLLPQVANVFEQYLLVCWCQSGEEGSGVCSRCIWGSASAERFVLVRHLSGCWLVGVTA